VREHDRLGPVAVVQLRQDVLDVALHRGQGDEQLRGDLGVRPTTRVLLGLLGAVKLGGTACFLFFASAEAGGDPEGG
jgi:hypothetical protein